MLWMDGRLRPSRRGPKGLVATTMAKMQDDGLVLELREGLPGVDRIAIRQPYSASRRIAMRVWRQIPHSNSLAQKRNPDIIGEI